MRYRTVVPIAVVFACMLVLGALGRVRAQTTLAPTAAEIPYATVDGKTLGLDLYLPAGVSQPSLLVWVHGGAWKDNSKSSSPPRVADRKPMRRDLPNTCS